MPALAETAFEHEVDRLVRIRAGLGDDHAFARRPSVRLDHDGQAQRVRERFRRHRFAEAAICGGRNSVLGAEVFHKTL